MRRLLYRTWIAKKPDALELRQNLTEIEFVQLAALTTRVLSHYLRQQMLPLQLPSKSCQENFLLNVTYWQNSET